MTQELLGWVHNPDPERGISFRSSTSTPWDRWSYPAIAAAARRAAREVRSYGVGPGDVVLLLYPNGLDFVAAFYGTLLARAVPAPIAPPAAFGQTERFSAHLNRVIKLSAAVAILTDNAGGRQVDKLATPAACHRLVVGRDAHAPAGDELDLPDAANLDPADVALLQFSSGSSGSPKGVVLSVAALDANIRSIATWLDLDRDARAVTWLPIHHDMGLVGTFLTAVAHQMDLSMLTPDLFIRAPVEWLRALSAAGPMMTASPNFALDHTVRRLRDTTGLDLSGVSSLIVGSERIVPATLNAFLRVTEPLGLSPEALAPAYGLAEASLAVTGTRLDRKFSVVSLEAGGSPVPVNTLRDQLRVAPSMLATGHVIGAGPPLSEMSISITDGEVELPEGRIGEVRVSGPSLASRILTDDGPRDVERSIATGDMGFVVDGELYVLGRLGDAVKVRGRWLFAEDLELVALAASPRPRQTAALLGELGGQPHAVLILENGSPEALETVAARVRPMAGGVRLLTRAVPTGWIQRTTSGKMRRREMWSRLLTELAAESRPPKQEADR